MADPVQERRFEKQFSAIESSFRIEGMDPSGDPIYEAAKAAVISGELTPQQALSMVLERSKESRKVHDKATMVTA